MPERIAPDVSNFLSKRESIAEKGKPIPELFELPRREHIAPELLSITEAVGDISGTWNPVEIYSPTAESEEREKKKFLELFDAHERYEPSFDYAYANSLDLSEPRKQLMEQIHRLRKFKPNKENRINRLFRAAVYFKIKDDLATCDLVDGIKEKDEEKIGKALKLKYPGTDGALLDTAHNSLEATIKDENIIDVPKNKRKYLLSDAEEDYLLTHEISPEELAEMFSWGLKEYGILYSEDNQTGYKVVVTDEVTAIDVRDKSKNGPTVFIPKRSRKLAEALGLLAHEIEGHARQSVNGERTFLIGGGKLKIDNEMLYEGLGKRYENRFYSRFFGMTQKEPLPFYTLATHDAEQGKSFYDIFAKQLEYRLRILTNTPLDLPTPARERLTSEQITKAKNDAWTTTRRIMRGHTDMTNPKKFAMAKDLAYLRGYIIDRQLQNNGLGFLNEEGIIASGGLQLMAELKLTEGDLPLPFKDITTKYWETVARPGMQKTQSSSNQTS